MSTDIDATPIAEGTEVFASDGEKLGTVTAIEDGAMVVEKGLFFPTDYSIPTSAVASVEHGKAYLSLTKDDVLNQTWQAAPPIAGTTTTDDTAIVETTGSAATARVAADGTMRDDVGATFAHRQDSDRTHQNIDDGLLLQLHEEELTATTRPRTIGEVRVELDVVEEQRTIEVPVTEERVRIERHAVDRPLAAEETAFEQAAIAVPIRGEEVELQKQVRVAEEVAIGKETVQLTEEVTGIVRREEVRVSGDVEETTGSVEAEGQVSGVERGLGRRDRKR